MGKFIDELVKNGWMEAQGQSQPTPITNTAESTETLHKELNKIINSAVTEAMKGVQLDFLKQMQEEKEKVIAEFKKETEQKQEIETETETDETETETGKD